jgi:hypothetical protein
MAPNTTRAAAERALAPSSTTSGPSSKRRPREDQVGQQGAYHSLVLRGAIPQPDRLVGAVGGNGQRDHYTALGRGPSP